MYSPADKFFGFHVIVCVPTGTVPLTKVSTSFPVISYICKDVLRFVASGISNEMVVLELKGLG